MKGAPGHGKRSGYYSDYTFGVWREDANGDRSLTPVGKAYFGFTDEELKQLDKFVRDNTIERFEPPPAVGAERPWEASPGLAWRCGKNLLTESSYPADRFKIRP